MGDSARRLPNGSSTGAASTEGVFLVAFSGCGALCADEVMALRFWCSDEVLLSLFSRGGGDNFNGLDRCPAIVDLVGRVLLRPVCLLCVVGAELMRLEL